MHSLLLDHYLGRVPGSFHLLRYDSGNIPGNKSTPTIYWCLINLIELWNGRELPGITGLEITG